MLEEVVELVVRYKEGGAADSANEVGGRDKVQGFLGLGSGDSERGNLRSTRGSVRDTKQLY